MAEPLIVAIDGPSGVGKSTVAGLLARRLGVPRLDTGATYRAVALAVLEARVDPDDRAAVVRVADTAVLDLRPTPDGLVDVCLDGEPVEGRIRTPEVSETTSRISVYPEVRRRLVALQRRFGERHGAVAEGRDIGTVVFPSTPHKFFLEARPEVRAERRYRELAERRSITREQVRRDLDRRDARDRGRDEAPLRHDDSYVVLDTSELDLEAVVERMIRRIGGALPS